MTETAADEQDLAKALDSVASAASGLDGTATTVQPQATATVTPVAPGSEPIVPLDSPVAPVVGAAPTYPPIIPAHGSSDTIEEFTVPTPPPVVDPAPVVDPVVAPVTTDSVDTTSVMSTPSDSTPLDPSTVVDGPLADIKNDALNELRPLVDKLDVTPEEKFDTYLLLIRSTDDTNLVGPAHEAAKSITDEAKRAEALLEIIKEIDYLSRKK